jgi:hypothetical protein
MRIDAFLKNYRYEMDIKRMSSFQDWRIPVGNKAQLD